LQAILSCTNYSDGTNNENVKAAGISSNKLLAAYVEEKFTHYLVMDSMNSKKAIKISAVGESIITTDSLNVLSKTVLKSMKYPYTYLIAEKEVITVFAIKIIHPSSNWQGQSPGNERVFKRYKRKD